MAFTLSDANQYFRADMHPLAAVWNAQDDDTKKAALAFARKQLERRKRDTLETPASSAGNVDIREDYAHYEQALWIIRHNTLRANGEMTAANYDITTTEGEPAEGDAPRFSPEALAWMYGGRIRIYR